MNCQAPLPADDDGTHDPTRAADGVDQSCADSGGGAVQSAFVFVAWCVLAIGCGLATVALVIG